ncbi:hypothetical protein ATK17_3758 [Branchiibius hedensis]|uniref:MinD-like ATPase involved in chromosome partitioning or flagellar assembly n=1 Tax=Branchiibius hedensis TaxID=672460 RepID=A0A2Y9BN55_9MICO|nr:hypothetical protein [Branchiibius hedensis]PWJ23265.1 hypothetical protein ATK17_3758 [Branchiibius hedensis]SSA58954.1 hypothetical protein SAMN04489750_3758 [Branchiibius hedensis]
MTQQILTDRPAISVDELKRAWAAVQAGDFRANTARHTVPATQPRAAASAPGEWQAGPGELFVPVLSCGGSTGATTLAVAIATTAGVPARVVECASVTSSGLAAASTAELGSYATSWSRGARDQVLLERVTDILTTAEEIPHPSTPDRPVSLTVLDIGWELGQVLTTPGWIGDAVRTARHLVLTSTATVPGMRRLEGALDLLDGNRACAAVLGPRRKKWPKSVEHTAGRATRDLERDGLLFAIPEDPGLAVDGLTGAPLPKPLLTAAHQLVQHLLDDTSKGTPQ